MDRCGGLFAVPVYRFDQYAIHPLLADDGHPRCRLELLFLSGTNLLRYGYREEERFKVQSFNDFLVFSIQGIASLSSGWFLYRWGWQGVLYASIPLVVTFALLAWFSKVPGSQPLPQP